MGPPAPARPPALTEHLATGQRFSDPSTCCTGLLSYCSRSFRLGVKPLPPLRPRLAPSSKPEPISARRRRAGKPIDYSCFLLKTRSRASCTRSVAGPWPEAETLLSWRTLLGGCLMRVWEVEVPSRGRKLSMNSSDPRRALSQALSLPRGVASGR